MQRDIVTLCNSASVCTLVFAQSARPRSCMMASTLLCLSAPEWRLGSRRRLALNSRFSLTLRVPIRMSSWRHKHDVRTNQSEESTVYNESKEQYVYIFVPEPHRQRRASVPTWQFFRLPRRFLGAVQQGLFFPLSRLEVWQKQKESANGRDQVIHMCVCVWDSACVCTCTSTCSLRCFAASCCTHDGVHPGSHDATAKHKSGEFNLFDRSYFETV